MKSSQTKAPPATPPPTATPYGAPEQKKKPSFFSTASIVLTLAGVIFLLWISNLPRYAEWKEKLTGYWEQYGEQKEDMSKETRMQQYYGGPYAQYMMIKKVLDSAHLKNPLILWQPASYLEKSGVGFVPPEASAFYFFTGYRSVPFEGPQASHATHFLEIVNGEIRLNPISSPAVYKEIQARYPNTK